MPYQPHLHHRRTIRLPGYDYSRAGAYFITICTQNKLRLFGEIVDGEMRLNEAGVMVQTVWEEIPRFYPGIDIDVFQMMPDHVHGIVILEDSTEPMVSKNPAGASPRGCPSGDQISHAMSLPDVVHRFKTMTTKRYVDGVKQNDWLPFPGKLWQRNYYERVIRDEEALDRIRKYIIANPGKWNGG